MTPKEKTLATYGALIARCMEGVKAAGFVMHAQNPDPLGIRGLGSVPIAWIAEMEVPGYVIERVGRNGIRIW